MASVIAHHFRLFIVPLAYMGMDMCALADVTISSSAVIGSNETLVGAINVTNSVTIINNGTINGTLNVAAGKAVRIENLGVYDAPAVLGSSATITQVITNNDGIRPLSNIGVPYDVLIVNATEVLNWDEITANIHGTQYTLDTSSISMGTFVPIDDKVILNGDVYVYVNNIPDGDNPLFTDVYGSGVVYAGSDGVDALHSVETYRSGGQVIVRSVRSTDYARVLNNSEGRFLNKLREKSPNDKLLQRLDSAKSFDEFKHIMSDSVRLHPIKLMQPIKTVYAHEMLETMHTDNDTGLDFAPIGIWSDGMFVGGVRPGAHIKIADDLRIKLYGYLLSLKYSDDINQYNAMSYGIGADVFYNLSLDNYLRAYGGMNISSFDAGIIFDGKSATEDPNGVSGYMVGEFGHKFDFDNKYYVSPFVMLGGDYVTILNSDDLNLYAGVGADAGFGFESDGLRYDYATRGMGRSDGAIGAELKLSVWSIIDEFGADFRAGVIYDSDTDLSYHVGLNAKFNF